MSTPLDVDAAAQTAQTTSVQSIVEQTMANNNRASEYATAVLAAGHGQMSVALQRKMEDLITHATMNNQILQSIVDALAFGIKSTESTDESNSGFQPRLIRCPTT